MAYTGSGYSPLGRFNDQSAADAFAKAAKASNTLNISAGQYFTGEGGTQYKTVSGVDPNQPGWGNRVEPGYQLVGYQAPVRTPSRFGSQQPAQGVAILKKIGSDPQPEQQQQQQEETTSGGYTPTELDVGQGAGGGSGTTTTELPPVDTSIADAFKASIDSLSTTLGNQITAMSDAYRIAAEEQNKRMDDLYRSMEQARIQSYDREKVAGVKTATGSAGTAMQIARRGVAGAFGRGGLRIRSLNV